MTERPSGARGRDVTLRYILAIPVAFLIGLGWGSPDRVEEMPPPVIEQRISLTPEQDDKLDRLLAEIDAMTDDTEDDELTPQERHIVDDATEMLEGLAPSSVDPHAIVVPAPTAPPPTTPAPPTTVAPEFDDWVEPPTTTSSTAP